MDGADFLVAFDTGWRTVPEQCDLLVVGEMGIANTTVAATLCAALMGGRGARWAGRGTGVDDAGLLRKRTVIDTALKLHRSLLDDPLAVAVALGGRELAAIAGAVLAARARSIPVLLDVMLGLGLDSDGHKRLTTGHNFVLVGGSQETHEVLTEKVIKINEKLTASGKRSRK